MEVKSMKHLLLEVRKFFNGSTKYRKLKELRNVDNIVEVAGRHIIVHVKGGLLYKGTKNRLLIVQKDDVKTQKLYWLLTNY